MSIVRGVGHDVQAYFLERSPKDLPAKIVGYISSSNYEFVGFTVFRNRDGSNWEKSLDWHKSKTNQEVELATEFKLLAKSENTFEKHTYSALKQPDLVRHLEQLGIEAIDICGIDTDACVLATAYEAFDKGYRTKILFDLCHSRAGLQEAAKNIAERTINHD
jgi:nicotinamidase-related amidase